MSKAIHVLKVWSQFKLRVREEKGLQEIAVFVSHLYAKPGHWLPGLQLPLDTTYNC